jgi:hypothetical protein
VGPNQTIERGQFRVANSCSESPGTEVCVRTLTAVRDQTSGAPGSHCLKVWTMRMRCSPLLLVFRVRRYAVVSFSVLRRRRELGKICGCGIRPSSNGWIVFAENRSQEVMRNMMAGGYTWKAFGAPISKKRTPPHQLLSDGLCATENFYATKYSLCLALHRNLGTGHFLCGFLKNGEGGPELDQRRCIFKEEVRIPVFGVEMTRRGRYGEVCTRRLLLAPAAWKPA